MSEKEIKTINELPLCDQKAREEIEQLKKDIANGVSGGSGLTDTAKNLLITILKNAIYETDQSSNITNLELELAKTPSGGGSDNEEESTSDITQVGSILTIKSGVTLSQSGNTLAFS